MKLHTARLPILFHDHAQAVAVAHTRAIVTGMKQDVRREISPAWPFGIWRVREVDMSEAL